MQTIMKTRKYIFFALAVLGLATSCERLEWGAPDNVENGVEAFGNKYIQVTNLKSIAEVKQLYQQQPEAGERPDADTWYRGR